MRNSLQADFRGGHGSLVRVTDFKHGSETAHNVSRDLVDLN